MVDTTSTLTITGGQDVFGADGDKVGSVSYVEGEYVVVSKGFFFPTDYYIPTSAIETVNDDGVFLTVSKDEALNQGWNVAPDTTGTTTYGTDQPTTAHGDWETGANQERPNAADTADDRVALDQRDTVRLDLAEEELTAQTRAVERGAVHVDKVVTEDQQTLEVPVTEERVNVTRRVVDREIAPDDVTFKDGVIEVPVYGEEVQVDKQARVREVLEVSKEAVTETQQVTDTVRREEARITDDTEAVVGDARPRR